MDKKHILGTVNDWASNADTRMRELQAAHQLRVIGYLPADFPEELFYAAGLTPFAVFGTGAPPQHADRYIQSFADPLARGFLETGLRGDLNFLEGTVVTHIDDTTRVLASIARRNLPFPWFNDFLPPKRTDTTHARTYLLGELNRLVRDLAALTGKTVSDWDLEQVIGICNRDRALLRAINEIRCKRPGILTNRAFYELVRTSFTMPKEMHLQLLEQLFALLHNEEDAVPNHRPRPTPILLSGYGCEHPALFGLLDELNALAAADDLMLGARLFSVDVQPGTGKPLSRIAERLLNLPPSPFQVGMRRRQDHLMEVISREAIQGVVFLQLKFSETLNYDYPNLRDRLTKEGVAVQLLETDLGAAGLGALRTRLEAFLEIIRGVGHE